MKILWLIPLLFLTGCSPQIVEVEKPVTEYVYVRDVIYIERIVEVEKIVEVEVPIELKNFNNVEELREWLGEEVHFILFGDTDCDDYALWLQNKGMKDGYLVNYEAIMPDEYNEFFKKRVDGLHTINSVIIGNEFYYIEPQTREIVLRGYLD